MFKCTLNLILMLLWIIGWGGGEIEGGGTLKDSMESKYSKKA